MKSIIAVFIGGGLGSIIRYLLALATKKYYGGIFPWSTFISNLLSCLILIVIVLYFHQKNMQGGIISLLLITGFCGGLSTFSTFGFETVSLIKSGNAIYAFFNVAVSLVVCFGILYLSLKTIK